MGQCKLVEGRDNFKIKHFAQKKTIIIRVYNCSLGHGGLLKVIGMSCSHVVLGKD